MLEDEDLMEYGYNDEEAINYGLDDLSVIIEEKGV